jgi:hypothetical protein
MKRRYLSLLSGAILTGGILFAQAPPPKSSPKAPEKAASLENTLELTLKQNADIKVAESKVREAEVELNRVRHTVLTKVNSLHSDLQAARAQLRTEELKLANAMELQKQRAISQQEVRIAQGALEQQQAAVQKLEAEIKAIRGEFTIPVPTLDRNTLTNKEAPQEDPLLERDWKLNRIADGETMLEENEPDLVPEKIRKQIQSALGTEILVITKETGSLHADTLSAFSIVLREQKLPFFILANNADLNAGKPQQIEPTREVTMPLSAALSFVEDALPTCKFVVKDYGLVLVSKDQIPKGSIDWRKLLPNYKDKKSGA